VPDDPTASPNAATDTPADLAGFPVVIALPVQWGDQDALGHVNNIVYFRWCESARIEYLRRLSLDAAGSRESAGVIVAAIGCDFRRPVTFPDTVLVGARITRIGRSSIAMEHKVYSQAQQAVVADASSTIVAFDHRAGASRPVADDVRAAIGRLEGKTF
jgi:acyl-CoA thioester hydrolase